MDDATSSWAQLGEDINGESAWDYSDGLSHYPQIAELLQPALLRMMTW